MNRGRVGDTCIMKYKSQLKIELGRETVWERLREDERVEERMIERKKDNYRGRGCGNKKRGSERFE